MRKLPFLLALALAAGAAPAASQPVVSPPSQQPAEVVRPHPWAAQLARLLKPMFPNRSRAQSIEQGSRIESLLQVIGSPKIGTSAAADYDTPEEIGPHGISQIDWAYLTAGMGWGAASQIKEQLRVDADATLYRYSRNQPLTLVDLAVLAPRLGVAQVVGTRRVDRGDGMVQEVELRLEQSWRGPGGTLLVRLPEVPNDLRRWGYLPPAGTRVLIAASRPAYLARPLLNGLPPSIDERVVFSILPMIRIEDGRAVLPEPLKSFPGMPTDLAGRSLAEIEAVLSPRGKRVESVLSPLGTPVTQSETFFVEAIDGKPRKNPLEFYFSVQRKAGSAPRPTSGYDGCNSFFRGVTTDGVETGWGTTEKGCDVSWERERAYRAYKKVITGPQPPAFEGLDDSDRYAPITVSGNGHRLTVRRLLR